MTDADKERFAYDSQVQSIARLLWENGEMLSDAEGRNPTWGEVCADDDMFLKRIEVEGYAKAAIAAGLTQPLTASHAEAVALLGKYEAFIGKIANGCLNQVTAAWKYEARDLLRTRLAKVGA